MRDGHRRQHPDHLSSTMPTNLIPTDPAPANPMPAHPMPAHRARRRGRPRVRGAALLAAPLVAAVLATSAAPAGWASYRIRWGDTLESLALGHHTSVAAIRRANRLRGNSIIAGALLSLPGAGVGTAPARRGCTAAESSYVVRWGDNLTTVAGRHGVSLAALAGRNHLGTRGLLVTGARLVIPARAAAGCAARAGTGVKALIRAKATQYGIDPALALAVASVESGFSQSAVSRVGAVGVMQLMPSTATWLRKVVGRPLDRHSVTDNITGGVAYLHYLLAATDRTTAVAAYYQGLGSVRTRGMYPDTRRYVTNVLTRRTYYL